MSSIEFIQAFLQKNIQTHDLVIESKPSITGSAVLFRASIDNAAGGNFATSGFEYNLQDALDELVKEIREATK